MGCNTSSELKDYNTPDPLSEEKEGETIVHINNSYPNIRDYIKEVENTTAFELIEKTFKKHPNKEALGYRKSLGNSKFEDHFTWFSYREIENFTKNLAFNIRKNGLVETRQYKNEEGDWKILGIFARNSVEWVTLDIALQSDSITSVTFYSTLGSESFEHIFSQTQIKTIAISPENVKKLLEFHSQYNFKSLKNVIIFDLTLEFSHSEIESIEKSGLSVFLFSDLVKEPTTVYDLVRPKPNYIITICYTSGTTSLPKGTLLTQKGFACQKYFVKDAGVNINTEDVCISYLPAAHAMERFHFTVVLFEGAKMGFISGTDIKKYLMEDISLLKPTFLIAVPKILINFQQKVLQEFDKFQGWKKSFVYKALNTKRHNYDSNQSIYHTIYDKIVFNSIREKFGGRIKYLVSASAPIPKDVSKDIKVLLSAPLLEGYGMTELSGGSNATSVNDFTNSNVGGVLRTLYMKLIDRKELNYHSKTVVNGRPAPTGEVCFKGPSVFKGYFQDKKNTDETIDSDGWMRTGDIGMIEPSNKGLKIIDRVKEIFKLLQGEYIAPAKLEGAYNKSEFVNQICIYGSSLKSSILAIVVINKRKCNEILVEKGVIKEGEDFENKYLNEVKLVEAVKMSFDEIAKFSKFNSLERPSNFILTTEEFSIVNGLLTPTMKLIRKKIEKKYEKEIESAYGK